MKIAISNIAWGVEDDFKMYSFLKKQGIKYLEIAPTRIFPINPYDNLERALSYSKMLKKRYDLSIVSIQSIWYGKDNKMFNSKSDYDFLIDYTFKAIDFAHAISCSNIVFGNPKHRDGYEEKNKNLADSFFISLAEYARARNIVISLEPNPAMYGTNFLNTTADTLTYLKQLNHPFLKLNLDLGTMIENKEDIESIIPDSHWINHIHISEPFLKPLQNHVLHSQLKRLKYEGVVSIEMSKLSNLEDTKKIVLHTKELLG